MGEARNRSAELEEGGGHEKKGMDGPAAALVLQGSSCGTAAPHLLFVFPLPALWFRLSELMISVLTLGESKTWPSLLR